MNTPTYFYCLNPSLWRGVRAALNGPEKYEYGHIQTHLFGLICIAPIEEYDCMSIPEFGICFPLSHTEVRLCDRFCLSYLQGMFELMFPSTRDCSGQHGLT